MPDVMGLDIETSNYSHEIGGWGNTSMFDPVVVATSGPFGDTIYTNAELNVDMLDKNTTLKELHPQTLGEDLIEIVTKGINIVGHNIKMFDLPILRDALDCWAAGDLLNKKVSLIDTSFLIKQAAQRQSNNVALSLNELCRHTLRKTKTLTSNDAPILWKEGKYDLVSLYCLEDARLSRALWEHGKSEGVVKSRCRATGDIIELEVEW
tara:strand:- start:1690 stop:2313 length:624 start_codon:yes stop_codon:yes gene_type:complete